MISGGLKSRHNYDNDDSAGDKGATMSSGLKSGHDNDDYDSGNKGAWMSSGLKSRCNDDDDDDSGNDDDDNSHDKGKRVMLMTMKRMMVAKVEA